MKKFVCNNSFIIILIVSFIILDSIIAFADPINTSVYFYKTDIEKVRMIHPKKVWDKVFFGNSIVIASFIEEKSVSGYINAGIDYGKLTDLEKC
jgi:hypothetical protein